MSDNSPTLGTCAKGHPLILYSFTHPLVPGKGLFGFYCETCDPEYTDKNFLLSELIKVAGQLN